MVFVRLLTVNLSVKVKPTEERKKSATPDSLAKRVKEVLKLSHHVKAPTEKGQCCNVGKFVQNRDKILFDSVLQEETYVSETNSTRLFLKHLLFVLQCQKLCTN